MRAPRTVYCVNRETASLAKIAITIADKTIQRERTQIPAWHFPSFLSLASRSFHHPLSLPCSESHNSLPPWLLPALSFLGIFVNTLVPSRESGKRLCLLSSFRCRRFRTTILDGFSPFRLSPTNLLLGDTLHHCW